MEGTATKEEGSLEVLYSREKVENIRKEHQLIKGGGSVIAKERYKQQKRMAEKEEGSATEEERISVTKL